MKHATQKRQNHTGTGSGGSYSIKIHDILLPPNRLDRTSPQDSIKANHHTQQHPSPITTAQRTQRHREHEAHTASKQRDSSTTPHSRTMQIFVKTLTVRAPRTRHASPLLSSRQGAPPCLHSQTPADPATRRAQGKTITLEQSNPYHRGTAAQAPQRLGSQLRPPPRDALRLPPPQDGRPLVHPWWELSVQRGLGALELLGGEHAIRA